MKKRNRILDSIKVFLFVLACFLLQACGPSDQDRIAELQKLYPNSYITYTDDGYFLVVTVDCSVYRIYFWTSSTTKMDIKRYK